PRWGGARTGRRRVGAAGDLEARPRRDDPQFDQAPAAGGGIIGLAGEGDHEVERAALPAAAKALDPPIGAPPDQGRRMIGVEWAHGPPAAAPGLRGEYHVVA